MGYLKFCGFAVKIPVGVPQVLWLRSQGPGWDASRLWFVVKIPIGMPPVCGFVVRTPAGIPQVCGFVARIPVGIPQVLWLRGQDHAWDTSRFVASRSVSRLGYLKFVASLSRSRLGYLKVWWLRDQDPGWDPSTFLASLARYPGWDTSSLRLRDQDPGGDTSSFVASWCRSRLGYLKFGGYVVKIPVGLPQVCGIVVTTPVGILQVLWRRGQDPGWNTSSFVRSLLWLWPWLCFLVWTSRGLGTPIGCLKASTSLWAWGLIGRVERCGLPGNGYTGSLDWLSVPACVSHSPLSRSLSQTCLKLTRLRLLGDSSLVFCCLMMHVPALEPSFIKL